MRYSYYDRLSAASQRTYRKSDRIESLGLPPNVSIAKHVRRLAEVLIGERRLEVQMACQALVDRLVDGYQVPPVRVRVLANRPVNGDEELHGLYEPEDEDEGTVARISIWMRTAQKKQVVAFRTFLRTLVHELCHHLHYELFGLEETFHTEGFYRRESSLMNALLAESGLLVTRPSTRSRMRVSPGA